MAVSALRTVLAAHAQSSWNRLARSTSKTSRLALAALTLLVFVTGVLPTAVGLFFGGYYLGQASLTEPLFAAVLCLILTAVPILGGALSGVSGGTTHLQWDAFRIYPVRARSLFAAELVAGSADIMTSIELLVLFTLCLGAAFSSAQLAVFALLCFIASTLMLLGLRLLFGSLANRVARRMRLMLIFVPLLAWMMVGPLLPKLIPYFKKAAASTSLQDGIGFIGNATPAGILFGGVQGLFAGHWSEAAKGLLAVVPIALLLVLAFLAVSRERDLAHVAGGSGKQKLWSFSTPMWGIARLQFSTLARSLSGRFGFVMPVITIVLIRGPLAELLGRGQWVVPTAFAYCSLAATNLLFNQFGLDGHGVKSLMLLPIQPGELLTGKLIGFFAWHLLQLLFLAVLLFLLGHPALVPLITGVLLYGCFFVFTAIVGQFTSVWAPRPMAKSGMRAGQMPLTVAALSMATIFVNTGVFGGTFWVTSMLAPAWSAPAMLFWLVAVVALQRFTQRMAEQVLVQSKEKLVETMSSSA